MDGYTQRALTEADAAAFVALGTACNEEDGTDERMDEEDYLLMCAHPFRQPDLDDLIGYFDGERLVAGGFVVRDSEAGEAHWMHTGGGVHPEYRGRGIGTDMLRWQQRLGQVIHERHFPEARLELSVGVVADNAGALGLLANEGFTQERFFFEMRRPEGTPVDDRPIPDGLAIETLRDEVRGPLRLVQNEVFVDHWHGSPFSEELWDQWLGQEKMRPDLSFLLRDTASGAVAGYLISNFPAAQFAETGVRDIHFDLIGTTRPYRGRGVASALIAHAVRESRKQGYQTASLGVDAENLTGALGVYERNGFACEEKFVVYSKVLTEGRAAR